MAIVTPALIKSLFTGYKSEFQKGLDMADSQFEQVSSVIKSTSASNTYGWLGQFPQFREWIGQRVLKDMEAHGYQINNKSFESTIGVKRTDIEDDNLGIYSPLFMEMGRAAKAHPNELVFAMLAAGDSNLCYDGQNFFDADHPVGETGSEVSVSNFQDGAETPWYLLDNSRAIKPIIFQERKKAEFVSMTKSDDEHVFMNNEYRYGVDCRCNVGYGFWQMAFKSKAALDNANFDAAYDAMCGYTSDEGRPLGIKPTTLVVGTTQRKAALELVKDRLADGSDNVNANLVNVIVSPWL